jgi:hypothetical protein
MYTVREYVTTEVAGGIYSHLEKLGRSSCTTTEVSRGLTSWTGDADAVRALRQAFDYTLSDEMTGKVHRGSMFLPGASRDYVYPAPLLSTDGASAAIWAGVLEECTAPLVVARLSHLLYELHYGEYTRYGLMAARAYEELSASAMPLSLRVTWVLWGIALYSRLRDRDGLARCAVLLEGIIDEGLAQESDGVLLGVALHKGAKMQALSSGERQISAYRALFVDYESGVSAYAAEHFLLGANVEAVRASQRGLWRWKLDHVYELGDDGLKVALVLEVLEQALRSQGSKTRDNDFVHECNDLLNALCTSEVDWCNWNLYKDAPTHAVAAGVAQLSEAYSLRSLLGALCDGEAPSGDHSSSRTYTVGHRHVVNAREFDLRGRIIEEALELALGRGFCGDEEIQAYLVGLGFLSDELTGSLFKACRAYFRGEYEEASLLLLTRIETLACAWSVEAGLPIYRPLVNRGGQGRVGLGPLLGNLEGFLDPAWHRFLLLFLVSDFGCNFRNEMVHGRISTVSRSEATLSLVCVVSLLESRRTWVGGSDSGDGWRGSARRWRGRVTQ